MTEKSVGLPDTRRRGAVSAMAVGGSLLAGMAMLLAAGGAINFTGMAASLIAFCLGAITVLSHLDRLDGPRFGAANWVTVLRAALIALLPALIVHARALGWATITGGAFALMLDGLDGMIARSLAETTAFGARFDMEVDALFGLGLSILVCTSGRAGAWILLGGLMRYLWLGAGRFWPVLRRPVRPSHLRKAICVLYLSLLLVALAPGLAQPLPALLAGLGLGLLVFSFGRDLIRLVREAGSSGSPLPSR